MTNRLPLLPLPPAAAHVTVFRAHSPDYVAVFVEGPDDVETWKPWLKWRPFPTGGCGPLRAAIESLRATGEAGYVGIIDADCERLEGREHSAPDLIVTEGHDLESDLIRTLALERLLTTVEDSALGGLARTKPIRDALLERAVPFGLLRWLFFQQRMKYDDGRLSPHRFIDHTTWALDEPALLAEGAVVLGQPVASLIQGMGELRGQGRTAWDVCNGHDILCILTIALRGPLDCGAKFPHVKSVSSALRLALDSAHRQTLHVWRSLEDWQLKNPPWVACVP